ncbi:hypothetical protein WJX79_002911 [Trebouxia sp. C0005]
MPRLQDLSLYQAVQRLPLLPFARELLLRLHIPDFLITHSTGGSGGSDCTQTSGSDPVRGNSQPRRPQQDNTTTDFESQPNHRHEQPWWQKGGPSNQSLASAKLTTSTRQATPLMDDELRLLTPCEVVRDALPAKLANTLLKGLVSEAVTWSRGTWYMGGKEHTAPRTSAYYTLHDTKETASVQAFDDNAKDVSASVDKQMAAPELKEAASIVSDHVNRLARRVQSSLASSDRDGWRCSYALCNMYQDGQEGVGPHADRLTTLGPRPIIASLSLGATRIFRIKCMTPQADATTKPVTPSSGWQQSVQLPVSEPLHAAHGRVVHSGWKGNTATGICRRPGSMRFPSVGMWRLTPYQAKHASTSPSVA